MIPLTNHLAEILILLFLTVTFGTSLIEKLYDWKGTIAYISETFQTTFIKSFVKPLIAILMLFEFLTLFFWLLEFTNSIFQTKKKVLFLDVPFPLFQLFIC
jgi:hypothetical protein